MSRSRTLRAGVIALACSTALSSCGYMPDSSLTPNAMPAPADVAGHYKQFEDGWQQLRTAMGGADDVAVAQFFVAFGYDVSKDRCEAFFRKVDIGQAQGNFGKTLSTSAGTGIGLATALSGAALKVLAGIFGATGIIPGIIDSYSKEFLLSELGDDLSSKVTSAMIKFSDAHPPKDATKINALLMVRNHASICTVPAMKAVVKAAVKNTEIEVNAKPDPKADKDKGTAKPAPAKGSGPASLLTVGPYKLVPK